MNQFHARLVEGMHQVHTCCEPATHTTTAVCWRGRTNTCLPLGMISTELAKESIAWARHHSATAAFPHHSPGARQSGAAPSTRQNEPYRRRMLRERNDPQHPQTPKANHPLEPLLLLCCVGRVRGLRGHHNGPHPVGRARTPRVLSPGCCAERGGAGAVRARSQGGGQHEGKTSTHGKIGGGESETFGFEGT